MTALSSVKNGLATFAKDIAQGFFEITHNGFALLGLGVMFAGIALSTQPELRQAGEIQLMSWLQMRQFEANGIEFQPDAIERAIVLAEDRDITPNELIIPRVAKPMGMAKSLKEYERELMREKEARREDQAALANAEQALATGRADAYASVLKGYKDITPEKKTAITNQLNGATGGGRGGG